MPNYLPKLKHTLLVLIFFGFVSETFGQGFSNHNWYFGSSTGAINFNKSDNEAVRVDDQNPAFGQTYSAVCTDPVTGELLFYTDGDNVYNAGHVQMAGGPLGGGEKPVAVCSVPGVANQYYIITNSASFNTAGTISFAIVDMTSTGTPPDGTVATGLAATTFTNANEGMVIIPKDGAPGFWMIYKQSGNTSDYTVLEIINNGGPQGATNFTGVGNPIIASTLKYNEATGKIAVAAQNANRNVQILDFDAATGALTFDVDVQFSGYNAAADAVFDTEWSESGDFLYISQYQDGATGDLLQYDVANPGSPLVSVLPATVTRSLGLKMGPDDNIYHLYELGGNILLGRINEPDSVAALTEYVAEPLGNAPFAGERIPVTLGVNPPITVDFAPKETCLNSPVTFMPIVTNTFTGEPVNIDSATWDFGDGVGTSNRLVPTYTYEDVAVVTTPPIVDLTVFIGGEPYNYAEAITVTDFQLQIDLPTDTTICSTPWSIDANFTGGTPDSFAWSDPTKASGQTLNLVADNEVGTYYFTATIGACTAYAPITIILYGSEEQRANVWYFGDQAGIDFNPESGPEPISSGTGQTSPNGVEFINEMNAPAGTSIISDRNGSPIFYTDGNTVWDRGGIEVETGIGGSNQAAQSALIVPVPDDETLFYIFTTVESGVTPFEYELNYSIYDIKENNEGIGDVTSFDNFLFAKSTERIAANDNWLIAHEYGSNTFRAYPITADGIGAPVLSSIGSVHNQFVASEGQGYMKLGPNNQLAVAYNDMVELFDFSNATGEVTNFVSLDTEASGQVYGVEFSPGGNNLYATVRDGSSSQLFQWHMDTTTQVGTVTDPSYIQDSRELVESGDYAALQVGPDGLLYIAVNGSSTIRRIDNPDQERDRDVVPPDLLLNLSDFDLDGQNSALGLPSFIQNISNPPTEPGMEVANGCVGEEIQFTGTPSTTFDDFSWTITESGSGASVTSSTSESFTHIFNTAGEYDVRLVVTNVCDANPLLDSIQTITVFDLPADPGLPTSEQLCDNTPLTLNADNGEANNTYEWTFEGLVVASTSNISPTEPGTYSYSIISENGCAFQGEVDVEPAVAVTLADPGPLCQDDVFEIIPSPQVAGTYIWAVSTDGGTTFIPNGNTGQTQDVDTSVPGDFIYQVTIDPAANLGCEVTEELNITVNESATFTLTANPGGGATCNSALSDIVVDITSSGSYSIALDGSTIGTNIIVSAPPLTITAADIADLGGLANGTYVVALTNEVTGCTASEVIVVEDFTTFSIDPTSAVTPIDCGLSQLTVNVTGVLVFPVTYNLFNETTGEIILSGIGNANLFVISDIPDGIYTLEITDNTGCTASQDGFNIVTTDPDLQAVGGTEVDLCPTGITLEVTSSTNVSGDVSWAGPSGFTATGFTINGITIPGTYTASIPSINDCAVVSFTVNPTPTFGISLVGDACGGVQTLEASPNDPDYTYEWFLAGTGSIGFGSTVDVMASGDYTVEATSIVSVTPCAIPSAPASVIVVPDFTAELRSGQFCAGDDVEVEVVLTDIGTGDVFYRWSVNGVSQLGTENDPVITISGEESVSELAISLDVISLADGSCNVTVETILQSLPTEPNPFNSQYGVCPDDPDPAVSSLTLPSESSLEDFSNRFTDVTWTLLEGDTNPDVDGLSATLLDEGTYQVELTNLNGCITTQTVTIFTDCEPRITAPNAFSPNGDGVNENFFVFPIFVRDFQIFIYSRWGEIVFHSEDRNFRWNGGFNNDFSRKLPSGSYPYVIKYISSADESGEELEQRGGVMLIR